MKLKHSEYVEIAIKKLKCKMCKNIFCAKLSSFLYVKLKKAFKWHTIFLNK